MANAALHNLYMVAEITGGVTPPTPTMARFRNTGVTLGLSRGKMMSKELKPNRVQSDTRLGVRTASGEISAEALYDTPFQSALQAVLCGTWVAGAAAVVCGGSSLSVSSVDNSFNHSANGLPVLSAGDMVKVTGHVNAANNGVFQVVSRTVSKIIVTAGTPLVTEIAPVTATVTPMDKLSSGTTRRSFSFMRHFADLEAGKAYHMYTGCEFNSVNINVKPEEIVTASFGLFARDAFLSTTAPVGSTLQTASSAKPMDAFAGDLVEGLFGGTMVNLGIAVEASFTLNNGIAPRFVIGSNASISPSIATSSLTGSIKLFFDDTTMMEKFLNETETAFLLSVRDVAGSYYVFEFPRVLLLDATAPVGADGPLTLDVPFTMQENSTWATHIRVWKVA